jgi:signal transduction histidine kinase
MAINAKKHHSLTVVLMATIFFMSAMVLLVSNGLHIFGTFRSLQKLINTQQQLVAKNVADTVGGFILEKVYSLEKISAISGLATASSEGQKLVLERLLGKENSFRQLLLFDIRKKETAAVSRFSKAFSRHLINYDKNEMFSAVKQQGDKYIGPVYIDKLSGEPMVIMAVPIMDIFGDLKGVLAAEVNLKFMWDLMDSLHVGNTGLAYVVNNKGNLIAFRDIERVLKLENLAHLEEVGNFLNKRIYGEKKGIKAVTGIMNTWVVSNHESLNLPDWAVVVELPVAEAYEPIIDELKLSAGIIVLSLVVAVLFSVYFSKSITKPLIKLRNMADEIGMGNMDTKIYVDSNDEIGDLASSFNRMQEELKKSRMEIEEYNRTLEQKVEDRTKQLQESNKKLVQTEKMAAVGQLANGIAHEINNPIGIILGFAQGINRHMGNNDPLQMPLASIEREAVRCKNLVIDLLTFSRKEEVYAVKTDVNAAINETLSLVEAGAKMKDVSVINEFAPGQLWVIIDKNQLQQVIINLCGNAMDAMPEGGKITITTKQTNGRVEIDVADTGTGMTEEVKQHIFEPFFTTKEAGKGTGLGLSLCYEIIKRYNGAIDVKSEYKKGAIFTISFPAA